MNTLAQRVAALIEMQGPISIAQFMTTALHDPDCGYYATHNPIGEDGDFITAPEVSQMFGELVGLWCVQAWRDQGCPSPIRVVELGPGRGTLMADALRAASIDAAFLSSVDIVLVEASKTLRKQQAATLDAVISETKIRWVDQFDDSCTDRPLFLIANEFFDALPVQQFVFTERGWCERMVGVDKNGALTFALSPAPALMPVASDRGLPESGAVYETSPAGEAIVEQIAHVIASRGGAALIVDYGYGANAPFGETLQGVARHEFASVLDSPGETDLSAHVDFAALARAVEQAGAKSYGPVEQGEFLCGLGIVERAERLSHNHLQSMQRQLNRLIEPDQMGTLFKALAVLPKTAPRRRDFSMLVLGAPNLSSNAITHGFFGRSGGISSGIYTSLNCGPGSGDDRVEVIENRRRALAQLTDQPAARLLTLYQIHSASVVTVTRPWEIGQAPQADAMVTNVPGLALGILTADCAPVLLVDTRARVIGAAHAGWKGALGGVTDAAIGAMESLGANRGDISAAVGPCISQANYEVGAEFIANFSDADTANTRFFVPSKKPEHFTFELAGYVADRLRSSGIASVHTVDACTYARESDFFSFRRATHRGEKDYGRQLSAILLKG